MMDASEAVVIVMLAVLVFVVMSRGVEKYNGGNNIDFLETKTDKLLPRDVMAHSDVYEYHQGDGFKIVDNE
jgi:hypothetical protein